MIFLGFISILQVFLPGLILTKLFYDSRLLTRLILSFSISLLFNYQFVLLTTALGLYNRISVWILFGIELILAGLVYFKKIDLSGNAKNTEATRTTAPDRSFEMDVRYNKSIQYIFIGLGIVVFVQFVIRMIEENPGIFDSWDDVVAWNRWATDWYHGIFPKKTWHYPQLMPANWSMMYQFVGSTEIQFFAKPIMSFFALGILLIFADLYQRTKSIAFIIALTASGYLIFAIVGNYIGKGYMDVPIAFFGLTTFYIFYLGMKGHMSVNLSCIFLALLVSAAILTKQAGFFLLFSSGFFLYFLLKSSAGKPKSNLRILTITSFLILAMSAPWYIYKQVQIERGIEESEIGWVTQDIYAGKARRNRLIDGSVNFVYQITDFNFLKSSPPSANQNGRWALVISIGLVTAASVFSFYGRISLFLITLPYFFIWGLYFSYDLRNATLLLPFLGLCIGIGTVTLLNFGADIFPAIARHRFSRIMALVIALILSILLIIRYDSNYFRQWEREKARVLMGDAELNSRLYELYEINKTDRKTLSGYAFLNYLPGINQHYTSFTYTNENLEELKRIIEVNKVNKTYQYLVFHEGIAKEIWEFLRQKESEGEFKVNVRSQAGWYIMETMY